MDQLCNKLKNITTCCKKSRVEWKNILFVVNDISRKLKITFYAMHFSDLSPLFLMFLQSLLTNNIQIFLLYFIMQRNKYLSSILKNSVVYR